MEYVKCPHCDEWLETIELGPGGYAECPDCGEQFEEEE